MNLIKAIYIVAVFCITGPLELSEEGKRNTHGRAKQESTIYKPINMESNPLRTWTKVIRKQEVPKPKKTATKNN